jgi:hypothetical protein
VLCSLPTSCPTVAGPQQVYLKVCCRARTFPPLSRPPR